MAVQQARVGLLLSAEGGSPGDMNSCHFIPPYLLHRLARSDLDAEAARCGHATLAIDEALREKRKTGPPQVQPEPETVMPASGEDAWTIHTANNGSELPGDPVRSSGEPESGDVAVDEAYAGTEASVDLFRTVFSRDSYDGRGAPVVVTVHYGKNYDNAFWDGRQLVFGDGDGTVFERFTKPIDVLAHEFTHAVTQYTSGFTYEGQSGALNESVSDVFAALVKQRVLGQGAADADWLIGEGIFRPTVNGRALRSMSEPGTAYDDPVVGKDPQVGAMVDYVETTEDNGGVHINSGIPNRAFHLAATALGGNSWDQAGPVWYAALTGGLGPSTDFATFAQATVDAAAALFDDAVRTAVADAWETVGVTAASSGPASSDPGPTSGHVVEVRRSGGFAGISMSGTVDLDHDERAAEVRALLDRIDIASLRKGSPQPDRFIYQFRLVDREITVHEQELTGDLQQLAALVLRDAGRM